MTAHPRKARILHCITSLDADGAQRMLLKLAERLNGERCEFCLVNLRKETDFSREFERLGIRVVHLGMYRAIPSISALRRLARTIDEFRPEILQGWMYHANLAVLAATQISRHKPIVVWNIRKSVDNLGAYRPATRVTFRAGAILSRIPTAVIYCGERVRSQHLAFGYCKDNARVIPNGFDAERFQAAPERGRMLRAILSLPDSSPVVGMFARFHPNKDHRTFLEMAAMISRDFPEARFVLAGREMDAGNAVLGSMIERLNIGDRIHLLGERNDIDQLYSILDVYCQSSSAEGFPNSVGEAMACGIPCVVTDAGASGEVVGDTGSIAKVGDAHDLSERVKHLLSRSAEERLTIGARARERICSEFSLSSVGRAYENFYATLLNTKERRSAAQRQIEGNEEREHQT